MTTLKIVKLAEDAKLPTRATCGSAGYDLYSYDEGVILPGSQVLVSTKIAIAIPEGYCGLIWSRSGLSVKNGIETGAGVIDSDYRKDVGVVLHNFSRSPFSYKKGMRIAQILITSVAAPTICEVNTFDEANEAHKETQDDKKEHKFINRVSKIISGDMPDADVSHIKDQVQKKFERGGYGSTGLY